MDYQIPLQEVRENREVLHSALLINLLFFKRYSFSKSNHMTVLTWEKHGAEP
jgi:hypothetical protein